tara:strand:+ start:333 stop:665 length:333 start_codon:yes stop_codon:yes gene_type:complete
VGVYSKVWAITQESKEKLMRRVKNLLIAFDQFVWVVVTLGWGYPDETISSASYRYEKEALWAKIMRPLVDTLFFFEKDHCRIAYQSEVLRTHAPLTLTEALEEVNKNFNK